MAADWSPTTIKASSVNLFEIDTSETLNSSFNKSLYQLVNGLYNFSIFLSFFLSVSSDSGNLKSALPTLATLDFS